MENCKIVDAEIVPDDFTFAPVLNVQMQFPSRIANSISYIDLDEQDRFIGSEIRKAFGSFMASNQIKNNYQPITLD